MQMERVKAVCIDPGATITLQEGQTYYLKMNGPNYAYVYKHPKNGGHWGCYQFKRFQEVKAAAWPKEPTTEHLGPIVKGQTYKAKLIWRREG